MVQSIRVVFLFLSSCSLNTWGIVIQVLVTTVDLKTYYNDMMFPLQKKGGSKRHEHDTRQLVRDCDTISTGPCMYLHSDGSTLMKQGNSN